jgi:cardiolipin synthase (CMP-forming)
VFVSIDLTAIRDGLLRSIAVLAPLSAAQYAWIVIRRMNTPPAETVV